jgi:protein SEY1
LAARFDRDASRYHQGVYKRKRADLVVQLHATLGPLFLGQLKNLHKLALANFKKEVLEGVKGDAYDFGELVRKSRERNEGEFMAGATGGPFPQYLY